MDDELEPLWPSSHPLVDNGRSVGNGASPFRGCHNQCFAGMFEISIFGETMMPASNRQPSHSRTLSRSERSAIAPPSRLRRNRTSSGPRSGKWQTVPPHGPSRPPPV